ncbi:MAG: phosphopentomutase, partial [Bacilli bacterium]
LAVSPSIEKGTQIAVRETFADIGATIADNFKVELPQHGKSFLKEL